MIYKYKFEILVIGVGGFLVQYVINELKYYYYIVLVDFWRRVQLEEGMFSYCVEYNKCGFEDIFCKYKFEVVIYLG